MPNILVRTYRYIFARRIFYCFNKFLYRCSLSGLGVLNYENDEVSGEVALLKKILKGKTGGVVFDVGANVGDYSKRILSTYPGIEVYAFEPHPRTFAKLNDGIQQARFHPVNAAVGDCEGELSLYDYMGNDGSSHASLYQDVIEAIHNKKSMSHKVRVITLDAFVKENEIERVALLKVDTEGNELGVLRGFGGHIRAGRVEAIQFEFNEMNVSSRTFFRDFWDMLPQYAFYRLLPNQMLRIEKYSPLLCEIFAYQNIVAILKQD